LPPDLKGAQYARQYQNLKTVLENIHPDWLTLTTHRLDIYIEKLAKIQFLEQFEALISDPHFAAAALAELPTAFDYIRLGHPLSCVLEWTLGKLYQVSPDQIISFSSQTIAILAILRQNAIKKKPTKIYYQDQLPESFNAEILRAVYGYQFELVPIQALADISAFDGSTIFISQEADMAKFELRPTIDFYINVQPDLGSIVLINGEKNQGYISDIQHVRRRETIAMTPADCLVALQRLIMPASYIGYETAVEKNRSLVLDVLKEITGTDTKPLVASSGLSIQYAIMMGLVNDVLENHPGKAIKFIVPPNCYGGTNDQARRVAASIDNVEVMDLPVDGDNDMVQSVHLVLDEIAKLDAVPFIIAEIPTNPRVEVPDLDQLKEALSTTRKTVNGEDAIAPVFILDQTFCPNVHFLGEGKILSTVSAIAYVSGSKFPSGGLCTAGYCVANKKASSLMEKIETHLQLCDNEATHLQMEILASQLPSMLERIQKAYDNTREFVTFIQQTLPTAKINFVSEALASKGFTPSVFSLDLPTKGNTPEEKETYKRALNHKLIKLMIERIPEESKHCVSYGQLKGCYWTIPATSTQGTTKEGDKDYIARVALSPKMDMALHKGVFAEFVKGI